MALEAALSALGAEPRRRAGDQPLPAEVPESDRAAFQYVDSMGRQGQPATARPTAGGGFEPVSRGTTPASDLAASEAANQPLSAALAALDTPAGSSGEPAAKSAPVAPEGRKRGEMHPPMEAVAAVGTGMAGTILGGLHGLYKLATGEGTDAAAEAVRGTQEALTYQPKDATAQKAVELVGSGLNPLNWPGMIGKYLAEKGAEKGLPPSLAAGLEASSAVITPGSILSKLRGARAPAAMPAIPEGSTVPLKSGGYGVQTTAPGGGVSLAEVGKPQVSPLIASAAAPAERAPFGSAGASATAAGSALKADIENATPELKAVFAATKGPIDPVAAHRQLVADSLPIPMRLTAGEASGDIVKHSNEYNSQGEFPELSKRYEAHGKELNDNLDAVREQAAPDVFGTDHVQNGRALIDDYKATDAAIRADITAKYKALEATNGGKFPIDGIAFVDAADKALAKSMKGRYVPKEIQADMEAFRSGQPMTFEMFENLRTNLAAEMRKADRNGDGNAEAASSIVRDALEKLPLPAEAAALKPVADVARKASKARFDLLRKDPAYKAAVDDKVAPDDFINKYVINGKVDKVKTMVEHFGQGSTAHQTMAAGAINYLKNIAGDDFSQAMYNKGLKQISPDGKLLAIVGPEAVKHLENVGQVAEWTGKIGRGGTANRSHTTIAAQAIEHAKNAGEQLVNAKTIIPFASWIRKAANNRAEAKEINEALQTGAGISLKDVGKKK